MFEKLLERSIVEVVRAERSDATRDDNLEQVNNWVFSINKLPNEKNGGKPRGESDIVQVVNRRQESDEMEIYELQDGPFKESVFS